MGLAPPYFTEWHREGKSWPLHMPTSWAPASIRAHFLCPLRACKSPHSWRARAKACSESSGVVTLIPRALDRDWPEINTISDTCSLGALSKGWCSGKSCFLRSGNSTLLSRFLGGLNGILQFKALNPGSFPKTKLSSGWISWLICQMKYSLLSLFLYLHSFTHQHKSSFNFKIRR